MPESPSVSFHFLTDSCYNEVVFRKESLTGFILTQNLGEDACLMDTTFVYLYFVPYIISLQCMAFNVN